MDQEGLISLSLLFATLRGATPLLFAALGGLMSERSGTVQIGLEGMMLIGALTGAVVAHFSQSPWLGFFIAGFAGVLMAMIFAFFTLKIKTDQIIAGTALNILAMGLCPFITKIVFNSTGSTPNLPIEARFSVEPFFILLVCVAVVAYVYHYTRAGLWLQFAGEMPKALISAGISLSKVRWTSLAFTGLLAGWGGASLSLFLASSYSPNMTAGRGFMALAALIFGKWKPVYTLLACLFFALIDAIQVRLQGSPTIPVQLIQSLPYIATIVALAGLFGHSRAPKALGQK